MGFLYRLTDISKDEVIEIEEWLFDCEITEGDIIEFIREELESQNVHIWKIKNIKAVVFEYILKKADVTELIPLIDINEVAFLKASAHEIEEAMANVLVEDRSDSWLFLAEFFGIDINIEEEK